MAPAPATGITTGTRPHTDSTPVETPGSLGVSRLDGKEDEICRFLKLGVSKSATAKITGVSRPTLHHFIGTRGLSPAP